ncbi:cation/H(+) antiporter 15-like [Andrographis paniculata]|uniref:cation/H(+) antiporter 15-like n=1 Tax=Andrographis paniculata TaxID=175694 RepID=UPI0021E73C4E|nr:cation/H(+) antiporter 15-like [Andrographis paniculata]
MNASSHPPNAICSASLRRLCKGIFYGQSPLTSATTLFLVQVSLCSLFTNLFNRCLSPLGQSLFVSQIATGVVLGPTVLGKISWFRDMVFPPSSYTMIDIFALLGVMFYSFVVGVKIDLSLISKSGKKALVIGTCTFVFPLVFTFIFGKFLILLVPKDSNIYSSIPWIGSFQAISSFQAIVTLLAELKLMNSDIGRLAIPSSTLSGVCSALWVLIVFTVYQGSRVGSSKLLLILVFLGIMVVFTVCVFRPMVIWMARRMNEVRWVKESHVRVIITLVLLSGFYGECFGQNFIWGPLILGMAVPSGPPLGSALVEKIEFFVTHNMLPLLFVVSAAGLDFSVISLRNFVIIECLSVVSLLGKLAAAMLPSLYFRISSGNAFCLGLILNNQGIMEVLALERAQFMQIIDREAYTIMVLSISLYTGILTPIVKSSYKPSKKMYMMDMPLTIEHTPPDVELRILACLHHQEHTPSILNVFEASYPHPDSPMSFYVIHLQELAGRSAPLLVAHNSAKRNDVKLPESEHIINVFQYFELRNQGCATVYPFTSISPYASMHDEVCSLAGKKGASLVIVPFHKHPMVHFSKSEMLAIRSVNENIVRQCPSSVGILVDLNVTYHHHTSRIALSARDIYRVGVIFVGGADDREALAYACVMARNPNIRLTVIRIMDENKGGSWSYWDMVGIRKYKESQMRNKQCYYQEEVVRDSVGVVSVARSLEGCFELVVVGRRHNGSSGMLAGLQEWNEYPELGCVGDMLVCMEADFRASVLVVQQGAVSEEFLGDEGEDGDDGFGDSATTTGEVLEMSPNHGKVWHKL